MFLTRQCLNKHLPLLLQIFQEYQSVILFLPHPTDEVIIKFVEQQPACLEDQINIIEQNIMIRSRHSNIKVTESTIK